MVSRYIVACLFVVFKGIAPGTWHVGQHVLPQSASFKYLGLVFHESGSMLPAFAKLAQNGKGAAARLNAKHKALMCSKSFPMMRRLFDAIREAHSVIWM